MKEESHKDEMRAALQGDFDRLRARRGESGVFASTTVERHHRSEVEPVVEHAAEPRRSWLGRTFRRT